MDLEDIMLSELSQMRKTNTTCHLYMKSKKKQNKTKKQKKTYTNKTKQNPSSYTQRVEGLLQEERELGVSITTWDRLIKKYQLQL